MTICVDEIGEYEWDDCPSCQGGTDLDPLTWHGCATCGGKGEVRSYLPDPDEDDPYVDEADQ